MTNPTTLGKALPIKYGKARNDSYGYLAESAPVYGSSGVIGEFNRALTTGPALIVGRKGSAGSIHYSAAPCWPIDTVYYAETPPDSTLHYFRYLLEHLRLGQHDKSTAIPSLSRDDYNAIPVSVPLRADQERVVAYLDEQLSRLDASVAALNRVQADLKRYRASVLKSACEGRLVPTEAELARQQGRDFETGADLLQRILAERRIQRQRKGRPDEPKGPSTRDLPELPEGWVWASAAQACDPVVDCHNKTAPYTSTGIPLVRTTNIRDGQLLLDGVRFVDEPTYAFWSRRCPPEPGDVLFTREAPMGEAATIPTGLKLCLGQRTMLMRPSAAISSAYLLSALTSPVVQRLIQASAVGSGVKHLRVGDVERLPIPLPPLAEQHRIVAEADRRLSLIRVAEAQVAANLARAQRLRQSILQAAFAG
jgi:type I restriction enzyme S subunit